MSKPEEAAAIGGCKQLFVDDRLIEARCNVAGRVCQAAKHESNPVLVADRPWELGDLGGYIESCFIHYEPDEELYKLWYMELPFSQANAEGDLAGEPEREVAEQAPIELRNNFCLAVSRDLVHWDKPDLSIVEYEGSTANNLFEHHGCLMIFRDPNESDSDKRYKDIIRDEERWCYVPEYAPDGLHWTADRAQPLPHTIRDDAIAPYYDPGMVYRTAGPRAVGNELWGHYNGFRDRHGPPYNRPAPGFTLADADRFTGDSVRHTVQWRGNADVSRLAGSDTRRHFELRGTRLYAFQFETDPEEATT